jgi:spermidine/putrescine transport system permease protein
MDTSHAPRGRRRTLVATAVAALALIATLGALAGCTSSGDTRRELRLLAWSEYVPQSVIDGFSEAYDVKVVYEAVASNEEMLDKLAANPGRYDLVQPSENAVEILVKQNGLMPLDFAKLPSFANIGAEYKNLPHDPEQRFTVPWMSGTVGIVVNTERIKTPIRSYADVFQDKHKGRIVVLDDPRELVSWALATLGHGPNDVDPETLEKARPVLKKWLPLIKLFDSDSPKTALLNGDVDIGIVWSGEAALLYDEHPKYDFVIPQEGSHRFIDSLAIPRDAPEPELAHQFIDYVLRPEVSRLISQEFPYTNPNVEARKLLTPAERANPASYPKGKPKVEVFRDVGDAGERIEQLVREVRATTY